MIYLDNASTSFPKPAAVVEAVVHYMTKVGATGGRGGYRLTGLALEIVCDCRERLARLINAPDVNRVIFCASCTDGLNMATKGVLNDGDHVVTTMLEHNSVSRPLAGMEAAGRITVTRVPCSSAGFVDPQDLARAIRPNTRLMALTHAGNVTGAIQPAAEVGEIVRRHDLLYLLDAAQTIGLVDIDVQALGVDLLAFPTHKSLLAPPGLGVLYVSERVAIRPWREGGTGADSITPTQPTKWPQYLEAGTPNGVGIAGLRAALKDLTPAETLAHERAMLDRLLAGIDGESRISVVGDRDTRRRVGTISIRIAGWAVQDVAAILDQSFDIAVRAGLHCAPCVHQQLGTFPDGTIRIAPGKYTTSAEIDQACAALREIAAGAPRA